MAAIASLSTHHAVLVLDDAPPAPTPKLSEPAPKPAKLRRPKGLLSLMVSLGAVSPPAPPPARGSPDPQANTDVCVKCRLDLFGGARGVLAADRCAWCKKFRCANCDAEHDGVDWHPNHAGDVHCVYYGGL